MGVLGQYQCGDWRLWVINAGIVKMDGGAIFGVVPKPLWEKRLPADARNRVTLNMNCLLVQNDTECVLIETGFGGKVTPKLREIYGLDESDGLLDSLAEIGISPGDVTCVVVTHLHQDHAGGCTVLQDGVYVPAFPNATYYIQQGEWADAERADGQTVNGYRIEEVMMPLAHAGVVTWLDGDTTICDGVQVRVTPGHTQWHQSVTVDTGKDTFCFIGDLIPTTHHLRPIYILAYDLYPRETYLNKQQLMAWAFSENWVMVFSHDPNIFWGRLVRDEEGAFTAKLL